MKILICGGGIAGLTLAFCLERRGLHPVVIEKSPRLRDAGYMLDFYGPGYDAAERMDLVPDLEKIHYPITCLTFVDTRGREKLSIGYVPLRKLFDNRHFNFMRGDLERLLHDRIKDRVEVRFGTTVTAFAQDDARVQITFANGSAEDYDLLVGADGVHSETREHLFGDEGQFSRFLGYVTAAFIIDDPTGLDFARDAFATLTVPGRQVGIYPIRGGRLATFFLHEAAQPPLDASPVAVRQELGRVYGAMGWIVSDLFDRLGPDTNVYFDAVTQIELPNWSKGRVTLVGDACQCVSLLAGQGASLAMAGASVLASELSTVRTMNDLTRALARYKQRIQPIVKEKQRAGRAFAHWFLPDNHWRLAVRDLTMRLAGWPILAPFFKRQFAFGSTLKL